MNVYAPEPPHSEVAISSVKSLINTVLRLQDSSTLALQTLGGHAATVNDAENLAFRVISATVLHAFQFKTESTVSE